MKSLPVLTLCLLAVTVRANDITLIDGKVLHNAKIINQDAASVTIKHSTGIARVMISRAAAGTAQQTPLRPRQ